MNSKELFSMALGLQHSWKPNTVDFIEEDGRKVLRSDIGFKKEAIFSDSDTGSRATFMTQWSVAGVS